MRNSWIDDPQYIVNLTENLVGARSLQTIVRECSKDANPGRIRSYVMASAMTKIREMNYNTLGGICSYSTAHGAHIGKHRRLEEKPLFINYTGLADVITEANGYDANFMFEHQRPGEILHEIALAVIVCVVVDLICQERWEADWKDAVMTAEEERQANRAA